MPEKHTKSTFLKLIKALNSANQYPRRHDYAFRHSAGRTESTKELRDEEMIAIINELENTFKIYDQCDKMRKKIISKAHEMFWEMPDGRADMWRIDQWCINNGPYHKPLNKHDLKELTLLVGVFEKVYKHYMSKI